MKRKVVLIEKCNISGKFAVGQNVYADALFLALLEWGEMTQRMFKLRRLIETFNKHWDVLGK